MRIDAFNKISEIYKASNAKRVSKLQGASFSDTLEISRTGKDYQIAKNALSQIPDVREAKINEIKQRMAEGTYEVTMEEVAEKLVSEYFDESITG